MPQTPVVAKGRCKVVRSSVFVAELTRVIGTDAYGIAEAQEQRSRGIAKVIFVAEEEVGKWVLLEADVLAVGEELYPLGDVDSVA